MTLEKRFVFFLTVLSAFILAACSSNEGTGETANTIAMPVTLSIPSSDGPVTRVGDPGTYEKFKLPRYAYIYITCLDGDGDSVIVASTPTLNENNWTKEKYTGNLSTSGDSIYRYTGNIRVIMPVGRAANGQVYVALSTVPLQGLPAGSEGYTIDEHAPQTVKNYQFTVNDEVRDELANIYSTPYNYNPDGVNYYGTLRDLNTLTPSLDVVLYHIAAKLDLLWNVDGAAQPDKAIDSLRLTLLDAPRSYIFKPLETVPTTSYADSINITVGNQYYGRDYRYVIPMTGNDDTYTFGATVKLKNGSTRTETIQAGTLNKHQPFTPWIRGTITVR